MGPRGSPRDRDGGPSSGVRDEQYLQGGSDQLADGESGGAGMCGAVDPLPLGRQGPNKVCMLSARAWPRSLSLTGGVATLLLGWQGEVGVSFPPSRRVPSKGTPRACQGRPRTSCVTECESRLMHTVSRACASLSCSVLHSRSRRSLACPNPFGLNGEALSQCSTRARAESQEPPPSAPLVSIRAGVHHPMIFCGSHVLRTRASGRNHASNGFQGPPKPPLRAAGRLALPATKPRVSHSRGRSFARIGISCMRGLQQRRPVTSSLTGGLGKT